MENSSNSPTELNLNPEIHQQITQAGYCLAKIADVNQLTKALSEYAARETDYLMAMSHIAGLIPSGTTGMAGLDVMGIAQKLMTQKISSEMMEAMGRINGYLAEKGMIPK